MGLQSGRQVWKHLSLLEKVKFSSEVIIALGAVLALVISSISLSLSVDASDKAYSNQRLANRLATAYRVAWHVDEEGDGPRQLLIENRSLIPAYHVLLLDETSRIFYRIATLPPCIQYSVDSPDGAEFDHFTMYFQTAGQWYQTDTAMRTQPYGDSRRAEAKFAAYRDKSDSARTSGRKPRFEELQGCG
ncbi:hypothetical protein [Streptomyces sp. 6N223]|uniref:hypothetical protein n=1 Tax=Streptomyces sp. 6N223 TaxID=3457412 RepID=UPI003FD557DE